MNTRSILKRSALGALLLIFLTPILAIGADSAAEIADSEFVNVRSVDPTIVIELRYASPNNFTHRPLYPSGTPAIVRFSVAQRLASAQKFLQTRGYGLKVWDAYRPQAAQAALWEATRNNSYVADPKEGIGSMHTRGAAVDATLVDRSGKEVAMPTDFDNFTPAAMLFYQGSNPAVRLNLNMLQKAMAHAGFYGLRTEWWHFCAGDWMTYPPVPEIRLVARTPQPRS